ncbi:MAG: hypothetical protein U1E25_14460 [Methylocystis sp.]
MTDLSVVKARLHHLPLRTIIAVTWRLKLARFFLWLARITDTYDGAAMRVFQRIVESAERCAVKADALPPGCDGLLGMSATLSRWRIRLARMVMRISNNLCDFAEWLLPEDLKRLR